MKHNRDDVSISGATTPLREDSSKLVSLLALATGAVAMPQSGMADIIYNNLGMSPQVVGPAGSASYLFQDLPGTVQFGFRHFERTVTTSFASSTYKVRSVTAGRQGGLATVTVRGTLSLGLVAVLPAGATWSQGGVPFSNAIVGVAGEAFALGTGFHYPDSGYDHQYLAWAFSDSTQGGANRYGWIEVGLSIANNSGANVTIYGYAYDDAGAKPMMGQMPVPEPNSAAILALGVLALGSRGLRKWRQERASLRKV